MSALPHTQQPIKDSSLQGQALTLRANIALIRTLGDRCDEAMLVNDTHALLASLEERKHIISTLTLGYRVLRADLLVATRPDAPTQRALHELDRDMDALAQEDLERFGRMQLARDAVASELASLRGAGRAVGAYNAQPIPAPLIEDRTA
jgi:hypothetical protein